MTAQDFGAPDVAQPPPPPVPVDLDITALPCFMLNTQRLLSSELVALASGEEFRAAVLLWCRAWHQVPAASLPDDDRVLASFAGFGRDVNAWRKVRDMALHGFLKCSDGRLYHGTLADDAMRASRDMRQRRERTRAATAARMTDAESDVDRDVARDGARDVSRDVDRDVARECAREGARDVHPGQDITGQTKEKGKGSHETSLCQEISRVDCSQSARAFEIWNEMAAQRGLARAQRITPARRRKLRSRLAEVGGLDGWLEACARVGRSGFLCGRNGRGWRADIDFVLRESAFCKLMEGGFDDAPARPGTGGADLMRELDKIAGSR